MLLVAIGSEVLFAAQPYQDGSVPSWVKVAPDDALAVADNRPVASGQTDYLLVDHQVRVAKVVAHYQRYVVRLVNQASVDANGQISIELDPTMERVQLHQVRVLRAGQSIDKLVDARRSLLNREQGLERRIINGRATVHLVLQDVRVGDVLDCSYTTLLAEQDGDRSYSNWFYTRWTAPIRHYRLRLLQQPAWPVYVQDSSGMPAPGHAQADGWSETLWDSRDIAALPEESARPAWHLRYPRIEISEFASWNAVREWAQRRFEVARKQPALDALLADLRAEPDGDARILRALRFVQDDIRYTGLEIGDAAYRPAPPQQVMDRRYGDCKDKVLLLVTLLRALGFESYPALVHSSMRESLASRIPSPAAFDHAIAKVHWKGRDYWLDATISGQGGNLDSLVQADFGPALVLGQGTGDFEYLPRRDGAESTNEVRSIFDFSKGTDQPATVKIRSLYRNEEADRWRVRMRTLTEAELGQQFLDYRRKRYAGIGAQSPLTVHDDRTRNTFAIDESYVIDRAFELDKDRRVFYLEAYLISEESEQPDQVARTSPLARSYPMHVRQQTEVYLPGGWKFSPDRIAVHDPAFEYLSTASFEGGKLQLDYDLRNISDNVGASRLAEFLEKLKRVHDDAFFTLSVKADGAHASGEAPVTGPSFRLIAALIIGLGLGVAAARALARSRWRLPDANLGAPEGRGGWMIFPVFGTILTPFVTLHSLGGIVYNWGAALMNSQTGMVQFLLMLLVSMHAVELLIAGICIWTLIQRYRVFPLAFVLAHVLGLLMMFVDSATVHAINEGSTQSGSGEGPREFARVLGILLWSTYMMLSQRVRATFVVPWGGDERAKDPVQKEPAEASLPQQGA